MASVPLVVGVSVKHQCVRRKAAHSSLACSRPCTTPHPERPPSSTLEGADKGPVVPALVARAEQCLGLLEGRPIFPFFPTPNRARLPPTPHQIQPSCTWPLPVAPACGPAHGPARGPCPWPLHVVPHMVPPTVPANECPEATMQRYAKGK